ncbi:MAG: hypothetical protein GY731_15680 [Gammaproteobacteria bacterium]|nr:hypothetical protein [Gammaproteobacteria bacterium]
MHDLEQLTKYYSLADRLMAEASKDDLAESLQVLAMNLAQYQASFGELPARDYLSLSKMDKKLTPELARTLTNGMELLVGVVGTITGEINIEEMDSRSAG